MKTFYIITCLLIFALSQQVVYAQQPPATEPTEESAEGFIKLGMPLEEALTKITFMIPNVKSGELEGKIVFEGENVTREKDYIRLRMSHDLGHRVAYSSYTLLSKYAIESNRYIFVPLADWGGGSGVFLDLNVVDKKTFRTVDSVGLGDRARIEKLALANAHGDTVTITSIRREVKKGEPLHDPKKAITKHFRMIEGILREVENPLSPSHPDMMFIPAGNFDMGIRTNDNDGEDDEKPRHTVYLDAFHIDRYEVTNAQYKKFIDANPQWQKNRIPEKYHDGDYLKHWNGNNYPPDKGKHPVVYVSWYAAMAYAEWRGKRLPTEAEWEKAARGVRYGRDYAWGDSLDPSKANYGEEIGDTTPVGTYDMNGYGLYDMTGNVWEWCLDEYDADFYSISPPRNPLSGRVVNNILSNFTNIRSARVLRGGSWVSNAKFVRVSDRTRFTPRITNNARGFRCVKPVTP
jgi:formylglycine-generating enzyme required for sulfatase activity